MKGIFINCPNCRKLLLKDAYIRVGSFFSGECARCGFGYLLRSESGKVTLKAVRQVQMNDDDEDGNDVVFLSS